MIKTFFMTIIILLVSITGGCAIDIKPIPPPPEYVPHMLNEVGIGPNAIVMPLNRFLLVRKGINNCAVKFTAFWPEADDEQEQFSRYKVYYQNDGTGDFSKNTVKIDNRETSLLRPIGIGRLIHQPGKPYVQCGFYKLYWVSKGSVCFFEEGQPQKDYGFELAPTPWTDIKEVNVSDPRIKWYRYDENRPRRNIPIDKLWESKE